MRITRVERVHKKYLRKETREKKTWQKKKGDATW
jgi:hypothetical protein